MSDEPEALVEKAAKALHADVCCPADGMDGACAYPNDLWGDRHAARIALEAVADDIRAELLESGPLPEGWERDTYVSLIDVDEWLSQVVIHGPWREGRHD